MWQNLLSIAMMYGDIKKSKVILKHIISPLEMMKKTLYYRTFKSRKPNKWNTRLKDTLCLIQLLLTKPRCRDRSGEAGGYLPDPPWQ